MSALEDIVQAALTADDSRKAAALRALRGEVEAVPERRRPMSGPLLLNMGQAAKLLGVSRATLWRLIQDGRLPKVELRRDSFRIRREDLEALADNRKKTGTAN